MCGLTGIIFGKSSRTKEDYEELCDIFTDAFLFSEERGYHASGIVTLSVDGNHRLYKLPMPPSKMVELDGYNKILKSVNNKTTILMGHSRWKTVGSEFNNVNNQPIIAGPIIGTHNGTIRNHNFLFRDFQFKRFAEVDSEILFRMAEASLSDGVIQTSTFQNYISHCCGSLSCVYVSKTDPQSVYLFHGDKPLFLFYNKRLQVLIYSSSDKYIRDSIRGSDGWELIYFPENKMYQTNYSDFSNIVSETFFYNRETLKSVCKSTTDKQLMLPYYRKVIYE